MLFRGIVLGDTQPLSAEDDAELKELSHFLELKYGGHLQKIKTRKQEILIKDSTDLVRLS